MRCYNDRQHTHLIEMNPICICILFYYSAHFNHCYWFLCCCCTFMEYVQCAQAENGNLHFGTRILNFLIYYIWHTTYLAYKLLHKMLVNLPKQCFVFPSLEFHIHTYVFRTQYIYFTQRNMELKVYIEIGNTDRDVICLCKMLCICIHSFRPDTIQ